MIALKLPRVMRVSIHAPARGATRRGQGCWLRAGVSIHAPARGATSVAVQLINSILFQSTRPRGARQGQTQGVGGRAEFQSTRPRGARPADRRRVFSWKDVSIHAPARGATRQVGQVLDADICFNPRAREGRDVQHVHNVGNYIGFQSTRPRGARRRTAGVNITI